MGAFCLFLFFEPEGKRLRTFLVFAQRTLRLYRPHKLENGVFAVQE